MDTVKIISHDGVTIEVRHVTIRERSASWENLNIIKVLKVTDTEGRSVSVELSSRQVEVLETLLK